MLAAELADAYTRALEHYSAGKRAEAARLCGDILQLDPQYAEALFLLGAIELDSSRAEQALKYFQGAAERQPKEARYHNALAEAYRALGHLTAAADCFRTALGLDPGVGAAHQGLGLVLLDSGDTAGAIQSFEAAVAARPDNARAHLNLGRARQIQGDLVAAAASYTEALRLQPDYAIARNNLGALLHAQRRPAEAMVHLERAIELQADYPEAHYNLGNALQSLDQRDAACASYREALRLRPGYVNALLQLGIALESLGQYPGALSAYETLLAAAPRHGEAWQRLGRLRMLQRRWEAARAAFENAARFLPDPDDVLPDRLHVRQMLCDWSRLEADSERLWARTAARLKAGAPSGMPPFFAVALAWPGERQLAIARAEACTMVALHEPPRAAARPSGERLRIGYLSGDLQDHAVGHLTRSMFALHDRTRFEVFGYSYGFDDGSDYRARIRAECEHFADVRPLSIRELARRIADDRIDILIDMMGHTANSRLEAMASRPASVQASWLSYPSTTGADFIDYIIVDRVIVPPEAASHFSEKLAYLPHCFMISDDRQPVAGTPARRHEHGLPDDGVVLCSWNNSYKIEPRIFDVWMRILGETPGSVLWLYSAGATMEANLQREAAARGVSPERLVFGGNVSPKADHLARLRLADLFLDTHLYNAHTTACDALWAGVPLLTCPGQNFASRVAASLLKAVGLPELIAVDLGEYERVAVRLAKHKGELARLRAKLSEDRTTSPLFDTPRFVCNLERAYLKMWEIHEVGNAPRAFEVTEGGTSGD